MIDNGLKIGVVIADPDEYAPFLSGISELPQRDGSFYQRDGVIFTLDGAEIHAVSSKIGKVNAAACAAHLIDEGCGMILSIGLSGGIAVSRACYSIGTKYLEHDFDLTPIGYHPCEKPYQKYVYEADSKLLEIFSAALPDAVPGTAVCGDSFISDAAVGQRLKEQFDAVTCDMETGAIAAVCDMTGTPFIALRRVSDSADESAADDYKAMNDQRELSLSETFFVALRAVIAAWDR